MHRIEIDSSLCSGFGSCIDVAPELFRLGEDGIAVALVDGTADPRAVEAADACPMGAIVVTDVEGREAA